MVFGRVKQFISICVLLCSSAYGANTNSNENNANKVETINQQFLAAGGRYGTVNDSQKETNTKVLLKLFNDHNGLIFEKKQTIQTLNLCLETQSHSIIRNLILDNYYDKDVEFTIGVKKGVSYQEITNLTLTCHNKALCPYGIKYGYGTNYYSEGSTINNLTISNYRFPLLLFTWNTVVGRIDCYNCDFGPFLLGTSLSVGALFCNQCKNGPVLGAVLDENGVVVTNNRNGYLAYSNIDIVSTDGINVGFCMGVGYVKYVNIGTIGMEARKSQSLITSFYKNSSTYNVGSIVPEYCPRVFYQNSIRAKTPDNINVTAVFGENIHKAFEKSDKVNVFIERGTPYLSSLKGGFASIHLLTPTKKNGAIRNDVFFRSELTNGGGSRNGELINTSNSFGKYAGIITAHQRIRINLRGSMTLASSDEAIYRQIIFLGKLIVGDADQHNGQHVLGESIINVAIDSYKKGGTYKPHYTRIIEGIRLSVDSSKDIPALLIDFPKGKKDLSFNYVYNLECIGGAYTSVEIESSN